MFIVLLSEVNIPVDAPDNSRRGFKGCALECVRGTFTSLPQSCAVIEPTTHSVKINKECRTKTVFISNNEAHGYNMHV